MKNVMRCTLVYEIPVNPGNIESLTKAADHFAHIQAGAENAGEIVRATADCVRIKDKPAEKATTEKAADPLPENAGSSEGA